VVARRRRGALSLGDGGPLSRYVVTGCAGFIGSRLAETLLNRGAEVVGVDAFTEYYDRRLKERNLEAPRSASGFSLAEADLVEADLEELFADSDGIFHLAAQPGVRASWGSTFERYVRDNINATQRVFEIAAAHHIRVVFASTSSIYGNAEAYPTSEDALAAPISPYGVTKLACEQLAAAYHACFGLEAVVLRYFTVYGPRQRPDMAFTRLLTALRDETEFEVFGSGDQSRQVTYVDDAVDATALAMERAGPGTVYNVGGGSEASLNDVIELAESLSGRRLRRTQGPDAAGDVRRTAADISAIGRDLGWRPKTRLEAGLKAQTDWVFAAETPAT
jgi:UDP-glucuronate 4-epimerase